MLEPLLDVLATSAPALALKASRDVYPVVNAIHIMAIATLFGAILALDLRLLGVMRSVPARPLGRYLPRIAAGGLVLAMATGVLLFSVKPFEYVDNRAFVVKLVLVALGALHALLLHASRGWKRFVDGTGDIGAGVKRSAALSLAIWIGAILAGRFIAF